MVWFGAAIGRRGRDCCSRKSRKRLLPEGAGADPMSDRSQRRVVLKAGSEGWVGTLAVGIEASGI